MKTCFWCDLQIGLNCVFLQTLSAIFGSKTTLGAIFARILKDLAQIFKDFSQIFRDFAQIFRDLAQLFDKSKLL